VNAARRTGFYFTGGFFRGCGVFGGDLDCVVRREGWIRGQVGTQEGDMRLLQRYIMGELLRVFLLLVAVLTVMLVFLGLFQEATERGLRLAQILQILPFVVPSMLPFTIPATLLLTVCIVYGRISGDLEVVAAKAAGISATQLLWPAFLLGTVLTAVSFSLTSYVIPWAVSNIELIVTQAMEDIFLDSLAHDRHVSDASRGFSITVHDVQNRVLKDATFQYRTKNHEQVSVRAAEASMRFDLEAKVIRILLKNARGTRAGGDTLAELDRTELTFPLPESLARVKSRHMTLEALTRGVQEMQVTQQRKKMEAAQEAAMLLMTGDFSNLTGEQLGVLQAEQRRARNQELRFRTELHSRFSMAASCLFFVFVGGPFAMLQARRQFITTFVMCFLPILLIYYPVMFLMLNLSKNASLNPLWAMWVPNLILGFVGASVLSRVVRH